jgi:raffinose/stachyose/melibiose transport system substrate-binding protein
MVLMLRFKAIVLTTLVLGLATALAQTVTVWDQWYRGVENDVVEQLNREFEEEHGVTVERTTRPLDDLKITLMLAVEGGEGPAVGNVNQGAPDMGEMVRSGLLLPVDAYAEEHGWLDTFSEGLLTRNRWSDDLRFGEGSLYGVAPQAEIVGVYYNQALFDQAGIEVPETFEAFEENLATLRDAGITPIVYGGLDGWPGIHLYGAIQHLFVDREYVDDLVYGRGGSWVSEGNAESARRLVDWVEQGYFIDGFEGIGYDDTWTLFAQGLGAMMITGSWITGEIADNPDIGFFAMPPLAERAGEVPMLVGGTGIPLAITVNAEDPDLAARYIDWMVSPRAAELWAEAGFVPAMATPPGIIEPDSLQGQVLTVWDRVNEADAIGHYLDWATPSMYDTITASIQELMVGRIDVDEFLRQLDTDFQAYLQGQ